MKNKKKMMAFLLFFIIANCSKIQVITPQGNDFYSKPFLEEIKSVKVLFRKGEKESSLGLLSKMENKTLSAAENSFRKNLMGVILFSQSEYLKAISLFKDALSFNSPDKGLIAQINLNLASTFFKINDLSQSLEHLSAVDEKILNLDEWKKYHHLKYIFAKKDNDQQQMLRSLVYYLGGAKNLRELVESSLFPEAERLFFELPSTEREQFLKNFESERANLTHPYLIFLHAQKEHSLGNKEKALEFVSLLKNKYSEISEVAALADHLLVKMESSGKIQSLAIGIVLPLTGKRKKFAEDTLQGIDSAFRSFFKDSLIANGAPTIHIRDSMGNGVVGANAVRELIEEKDVSLIIGGLFSDEAQKEYLEAKKRGTFFISLSTVFIPSEQKDHLLLEVPGSLESQVKRAFSPDVLAKFGTKVALLVPKDERGNSFVDASWRQSEKSKVKIVAVQNYLKDSNDFRETIKSMLGLSFPRERKEELQVLNQIATLQRNQLNQKKGSALTPIVEFDWVLTPAFPDEALRLLPTFKYFDAFGISFMGGPSWRSSNMLKLSSTESIFFIGNEITDAFVQFRKDFFTEFKRWPGLVETISIDAIKIASQILSGGEFKNRSDLERFLIEKNLLQGIEGDWHLESGLWIKQMTPMKFHKEKVHSIFQEEHNSKGIESKEFVL